MRIFKGKAYFSLFVRRPFDRAFEWKMNYRRTTVTHGL